MLTLLLAWLSKLLIEDPSRTGRFLTSHRNGWTFGVAAATTAAVLAVTVGGETHVRGEIRHAQQAALASTPRCFGATSRDPAKPCRNPSCG